VHGVIFTSLGDYLVAAHGRDVAAAVFASEPEYFPSTSYADEVFGRLIDFALAHTGRDKDELLLELGVFTGETTFARLYPAFFKAEPSTREFLLTVEHRIHELVRATISHASPPRLQVEPRDDGGVSIAYYSERRLCVLLRGLTEGAARHYGQHAELDERTCMLRGDKACTFEVRFSDGRRP
jgi:predicted hydrocarbon binding protein